MNMVTFVLRRALWIIPVTFGVVTLTFFLARGIGGDPVEQYLPADADQALRESVRASLGLDRPITEQYLGFVGGVLRGDLGISFETRASVTDDILQRFPATLELALWGFVGGVFLGIVLGVIAAVKRDKATDFIIRGVSVGGMAIPSFWIGLVLIFFFAVTLDVLPGPVGRLPIGMDGPPHVTGLYLVDSVIAGDMNLLGLSAQHLLLPSLVLAIACMGPVARVTRNAMVEALESDYIRTAVAMGHGHARVWFVYALRNALLPVITVMGEVLAFVLGGAVLVEAVFGWPGLGRYALSAIDAMDFGAIQGFVLYTALLYVVLYLLIDVLYAVADPRTRIGAKS